MTSSDDAQQRFYRSLCLLVVLACSHVPLIGGLSPPSAAAVDAMRAPADVKPGSITYEDVPYPYPVMYRPLTLYGQDVRMAYMDVPPAGQPNGRTVVLLHGMNFGGFYFGGPIDVLRKAGFRVVVPDQIGFGRSSKPIIPYNFHDMAMNTRTLLQSLGIAKAAIVGHSMGGMLAARFAASYPDMTERVVLYDPIGLTDVRWSQPWHSAEEGLQGNHGAHPGSGLASSLCQYSALLSRCLEARV
jgi:pimeloyl-ACP methyl ester carboxylesterase